MGMEEPPWGWRCPCGDGGTSVPVTTLARGKAPRSPPGSHSVTSQDLVPHFSLSLQQNPRITPCWQGCSLPFLAGICAFPPPAAAFPREQGGSSSASPRRCSSKALGAGRSLGFLRFRRRAF